MIHGLAPPTLEDRAGPVPQSLLESSSLTQSGLCMGLQTCAATVENSVEVPQKVKNRPTIQFSNPTSRYLSEEIQNTNPKRYMHSHVNCSIICNSQDMEATQMPKDRWMGKEDVVHIYNEILLGHKKE